MMKTFENFNLDSMMTVAIEINGEYISLSAGRFEGYDEGENGVTLFYGENEVSISKSMKYTTDVGDVSEECHIFSDGNMNIYIESF